MLSQRSLTDVRFNLHRRQIALYDKQKAETANSFFFSHTVLKYEWILF